MTPVKVKCGRCSSEFEVSTPLPTGRIEQVACPLCGFSKQDVVESVKETKKKILKG
jgi:DNA-directed RNA polymerase subunit RPC12/RpoP